MIVSCIICTRNRADSLRNTLASVGKVVLPEGLAVELLVIDNGSSDQTPAIVREARLGSIAVNYIREPRKGLSNARNTALIIAKGEIILFIDDDVIVSKDWLVKIVRRFIDGKCKALMGTILLSEHLNRSWMEPVHKVWLAATGDVFEKVSELTGASMGFHRSVLEQVPWFDHSLGSGALGFGEDSLFSYQLMKAGYSLEKVSGAVVIHCPQSSRLLRSSWLSAASDRGRSNAYLHHHWYHTELKNPLIKAWYLNAKMNLRRILQPPVSMNSEGCTGWEMSYVQSIAMLRHFSKERRNPRNYAKQGLVRLDMQGETRPRALELR